MQKVSTLIASTITIAVVSVGSFASPIIYPAGGQTPQQQQQDEAECRVWAQQNTGIDPVALAATPVPQSTGSTVGSGDRARGAARGAAGGAVIGAITGDTGRGAAIGATTGTIAGGRQARQNQAAGNDQQQAQRQQQLDTFNRAVATCMEGRGYAVR